MPGLRTRIRAAVRSAALRIGMGVSLIIAAAGSGQRFQAAGRRRNKPGKLFVTLGERPLLSHTLESFRKIPSLKEIVVALPGGTQKWVREKVLKHYEGPPVRLVRGGRTRAESVWKALQKTSPKNSWVMVHDGARPFPPRQAVLELLKKKKQADGWALARPVVPTLKRVSSKNGTILGTVDRTNLFEAQTPQLVRRSLLMEAYRSHPDPFRATDEASLLESLGRRVRVFPHSDFNLKVTTPADLDLAEAYYEKGSGPLTESLSRRVGLGRDTHRLAAGRKFFLGGVRIPFEKGALGHSDGDALLHAIADALLGAIGAGDIGDWFSDKDPRNRNIRSGKILKKVLEECRRRNWAPVQLDSVILLENPKLGPTKKIIRRKIAKLMGLEPEVVSVKAKTLEGLGPEGEGRAVTCEALVVLRRVPA